MEEIGFHELTADEKEVLALATASILRLAGKYNLNADKNSAAADKLDTALIRFLIESRP